MRKWIIIIFSWYIPGRCDTTVSFCRPLELWLKCMELNCSELLLHFDIAVIHFKSISAIEMWFTMIIWCLVTHYRYKLFLLSLSIKKNMYRAGRRIRHLIWSLRGTYFHISIQHAAITIIVFLVLTLFPHYVWSQADYSKYSLFSQWPSNIYSGWPPPPPPKKKKKKKKKTRNSRFSALCSDQQLSFFTLLDRASFPHYNKTKIIKFGWELFILWVFSYGL